MTHFLDVKRKEIADRLKELRPLVDEYTRLEAAAQALDGVGAPAPARRRTWTARAARHRPRPAAAAAAAGGKASGFGVGGRRIGKLKGFPAVAGLNDGESEP